MPLYCLGKLCALTRRLVGLLAEPNPLHVDQEHLQSDRERPALSPLRGSPSDRTSRWPLAPPSRCSAGRGVATGIHPLSAPTFVALKTCDRPRPADPSHLSTSWSRATRFGSVARLLNGGARRRSRQALGAASDPLHSAERAVRGLVSSRGPASERPTTILSIEPERWETNHSHAQDHGAVAVQARRAGQGHRALPSNGRR